jgi:hypothetical protein
MWRRIVLPAILSAVGALATVLTRALANDFNDQPVGVQVATVAAGVISLGIGGVAILNGVAAIQEKTKADAYTALLATLAKIADSTGIAATDLGLSAYHVKRCLLRPWRKKQLRITRVRLSNYPPRLTDWNWSKGVVGRCWKEKHHEVKFIRSESSYLGCTPKEWLEASDDERWGMNYEEWQDTQRYALIMAYPVQAGDKYAGCVSLDTAKDDFVPTLLSENVWTLLGDAAAAIGKSLGGA